MGIGTAALGFARGAAGPFIRRAWAWFDPLDTSPRWLAAGLIWAALCLLPNVVLLAQGQTPLCADSVTSNLPLKLLAFEQLEQGRLPLWTSRLGCGSPLAADTISLPFDPRNLWWLVLPPVTAYWAMLVTSRLVNGWICLAYFRVHHRLAFGPALVATVVYFFGTMLLGECQLHSTAIIIEALPGVCWLAERLLERASYWRVLALAAAWSALFLMGSVAYLVYVPAFAWVWAAARGCFHQPRVRLLGHLRFALLYGLSLLWAAGLCGVLLVPFVELVSLSNRGGEYPEDPYGLRSLVFALIGPRTHGRYIPHSNFFFFVGVVSLPLVLSCWGRRDNGYVSALSWLGALTLLGLIVLNSPLKPRLVRLFPALATVGCYRLSFFWGMLAAVLVGHGLQGAGRGLSPLAVRLGRLLRCLQLGTVLCVPPVALLLLALRFEWPEGYQDALAHLTPFLWGSFLLVVPVRLYGLGVICRPLPPDWGRVAVVGVCIAAEMVLTWQLIRWIACTPEGHLYPVTPEVAFLQQAHTGDHRISVLELPLNAVGDSRLRMDGFISCYMDAPAVHGLHTANIYQSLIVRDFGRFTDYFPDRAWRRVLYPRASNAVMVTSAHDSPLFDAQAVRFLLSRTPLPPHPDLQLRLHGQSYLVYERANALPRAYFVSQARYGRPHQVGHRLWLAANGVPAGVKEEPARLREEVHLEHRRGPLPPDERGPTTPAVPGRVIADRDSEVEVAVSCPSAGFVVLSDTYYPGWKAWVDGEETPILRANGYARAVRVGPGDHTIVFRYEPASFTWGLRTTALCVGGTLLASVGGWMWRRRSRRREGPIGEETSLRRAA